MDASKPTNGKPLSEVRVKAPKNLADQILNVLIQRTYTIAATRRPPDLAILLKPGRKGDEIRAVLASCAELFAAAALERAQLQAEIIGLKLHLGILPEDQSEGSAREPDPQSDGSTPG